MDAKVTVKNWGRCKSCGALRRNKCLFKILLIFSGESDSSIPSYHQLARFTAKSSEVSWLTHPEKTSWRRKRFLIGGYILLDEPQHQRLINMEAPETCFKAEELWQGLCAELYDEITMIQSGGKMRQYKKNAADLWHLTNTYNLDIYLIFVSNILWNNLPCDSI